MRTFNIPHKLALLFDSLVAARLATGDSHEGAKAYALATLWKVTGRSVTA